MNRIVFCNLHCISKYNAMNLQYIVFPSRTQWVMMSMDKKFPWTPIKSSLDVLRTDSWQMKSDINRDTIIISGKFENKWRRSSEHQQIFTSAAVDLVIWYGKFKLSSKHGRENGLWIDWWSVSVMKLSIVTHQMSDCYWLLLFIIYGGHT